MVYRIIQPIQLFKNTPLQDSFGYNMVSLVDGVPRTLDLAEMVGYYLDHQMEVVERRTRFRLEEAQARAHILEGLIIAVDNIDEVIKIIRGSADTAAARGNLIDRFELSEVQANAVLDMPLRRLTALEVDKLRSELAELHDLIAELEAILADPKRRWAIIRDELSEIKEKYGESRRSRVIPDEGDLSLEDLIADDELIVTVSSAGYIKSVPASTYKTQGRGGRGVKAAEVQETDVIQHLVHTTAHAYLLFFTNRGPRPSPQGTCHPEAIPDRQGGPRPIGAAPRARRASAGDHRHQGLRDGALPGDGDQAGDRQEDRVQGIRVANQTLVAIKLVDGDELVSVRTTNGKMTCSSSPRRGWGSASRRPTSAAWAEAPRGCGGSVSVTATRWLPRCRTSMATRCCWSHPPGTGREPPSGSSVARPGGGIGVKAFKLTRIRGNLVGGACGHQRRRRVPDLLCRNRDQDPGGQDQPAEAGFDRGPGDTCRRWQRAVGAGHRLRRSRVREPSANSCRWD